MSKPHWSYRFAKDNSIIIETLLLRESNYLAETLQSLGIDAVSQERSHYFNGTLQIHAFPSQYSKIVEVFKKFNGCTLVNFEDKPLA